MKVSIIKGFVYHSEDVDITDVVSDICSLKYKSKIEDIRKLYETNSYEAERKKKNLPAFTPCGTFGGSRCFANLKEYSGLIHLDYDKLGEAGQPNYTTLFRQVVDNPLTYLAFRSPSGKGLKVFIRTKATLDTHKMYWSELNNLYFSKYLCLPDTKCKDIPRLCFISHDPFLYFNTNSTIFEI